MCVLQTRHIHYTYAIFAMRSDFAGTRDKSDRPGSIVDAFNALSKEDREVSHSISTISPVTDHKLQKYTTKSKRKPRQKAQDKDSN